LTLFSSVAKDLNLQLGHPANFEANKLKNLTTPLSKLAKGMQNIGLNLDPRKIASKVTKLRISINRSFKNRFFCYLQTGVLSPTNVSADITPPERGPGTRDVLMEMWETEQCKTKLIAL